MAKVSSTLPSAQRARVFEAYRGRGRRTNQLWLVYSVKTNRDWILSSDRQFVHWLAFLEANPSVSKFDFPLSTNTEFAKQCIVDVQMHDGSRQQHKVYSGTLVDETDIARAVDNGNASNDSVKQKFFGDAELKPMVQLAMRWHKALCFATVLRDQEQLPSRIALVSAIKARVSGTVEDLLVDIGPFDEPVILGMLVRVAIEGVITLDLHRQGFCYSTPWRISEDFGHVVA
jgi:hypothetical protein